MLRLPADVCTLLDGVTLRRASSPSVSRRAGTPKEIIPGLRWCSKRCLKPERRNEKGELPSGRMEEQSGPAEGALKCGWLRKQGGFVKTWHSRWFVLKGDLLYYFKDEEETKPLGAIFLPGNRVLEHPCNEESPGKFLFEVVPEDGINRWFLDEVQSYSGINKMSVQNLATVFGPNILRPKVEDPLTIMEGTVVVQQLMSVMISKHEELFPKEPEVAAGAEVCSNSATPKRAGGGQPPGGQPPGGQPPGKESSAAKEPALRRCSWEKPEAPRRASLEAEPQPAPPGSRAGSPRHSLQRADVSRSPPAPLKKNPAFNKGSGIVTNGSFSSSLEGPECGQPSAGCGPPARRAAAGKGAVTRMGTQSVPSGAARPAGGEGHGAPPGPGRVPNGCVALRDGRQREGPPEAGQHHRLSTYDNVHQHFPPGGSEDKQSVDSASWSTSSCEISLPEHSTSCRSSTTTCPEQDFFVGAFEDSVLDGPAQEELSNPEDYENRSDRRSLGAHSSRATSGSENGETFAGGSASSHSALHSLVASLKQEMAKQKAEYETRIKSLEQRNLSLETELLALHEELDQERKKFTMVEIKMRNAERAKEDAEKRNAMLQQEMEQFFSTFGELTVESRRPDRANTIWIQ
ncbi:rho GTPase-activating protein 24-like [Dryobates pubescens]|uniref:rho GTPase-activating protein 24-like n=1 Tax=Dryobates pubescens TaxID=118200 RepID=UPI0023B97F06|nr:rho GTPase-activating protein 24-like [Dryobates pubescens]